MGEGWGGVLALIASLISVQVRGLFICLLSFATQPLLLIIIVFEMAVVYYYTVSLK